MSTTPSTRGRTNQAHTDTPENEPPQIPETGDGMSDDETRLRRLLSRIGARPLGHAEQPVEDEPEPGAARPDQDLESAGSTCGLLLDWAATAAPTDNATAAAAANAGHALRALDRRTALSDLRARAYLRDAFRDLDDHDEDDDPHPLDCAGRCDGTGEVLTVLTGEHHGDGNYTPVHQEPVLCFGAPTAHAPDCATCEGHGFTYTPGYRELCLDGRTSDREPAAATSASQGA